MTILIVIIVQIITIVLIVGVEHVTIIMIMDMMYCVDVHVVILFVGVVIIVLNVWERLSVQLVTNVPIAVNVQLLQKDIVHVVEHMVIYMPTQMLEVLLQ